MRVILVGTEAQRERLRARAMNASLRVVGEYATVALARASELDFDAMLLPPDDFTDDERLTEPLTAREVQVLELLAEGLPNKAIGERLGISDQTAKFHVASILGKLGAHNRTDAVRRAVRRGLVTL